MNPGPQAHIDLQALQHNLQQVRQLARGCRLLAVVKADAYGHGLSAVARALGETDAWGVARLAEGIALRKLGRNEPIVLLEGVTSKEELEQAEINTLELVIHSSYQLEMLSEYKARRKLNAWLKMDTGMSRLGFGADEFQHAWNKLQRITAINQPVGLMTHLAQADDRSSKMTEQQRRLFVQSVHNLPGQRSVAASTGILAWPQCIEGQVRPGIMLYGVSPFAGTAGTELGLRPVMTFQTSLISVRTVRAGESVGYSGTWTATTDTAIGVAAVGYGDGYPRCLSSGTPVLLNGKRARLVGRVSMDMITLDISSQPQARIGDPVTLWGGELPVEEIAECAKTIPYELLCGITHRVSRTHFQSVHSTKVTAAQGPAQQQSGLANRRGQPCYQ